MPSFSNTSISHLNSCHPDLQIILNEAIQYVDFKILEGHRNKKRQDELFIENKTKVEYPNSKHNSQPSLAVDIAPYPINWNNKERFIALCFFIKGIAISKGIKLRLGADWNSNYDINDESFLDLVHIELFSKKINKEMWERY